MSYVVTPAAIADVLVLEPQVFGESNDFFFESFNAKDFSLATGLNVSFVQDNHSMSTRGVLRGLHYQIKHVQGKLVRVAEGKVFDVVVDLRRSSPTFGKWLGTILSQDNHLQLWIPPGFAHGFVVLSERAQFLYKTTDYYFPEHERCLLWNDPEVGINWPIDFAPQLAVKDQIGKSLAHAELFD